MRIPLPCYDRCQFFITRSINKQPITTEDQSTVVDNQRFSHLFSPRLFTYHRFVAFLLESLWHSGYWGGEDNSTIAVFLFQIQSNIRIMMKTYTKDLNNLKQALIKASASYHMYPWHYVYLSNSLIIHKAKTKENHKCDRFGNMIKHLHKLAKLSPSFSPEVHICLRSRIKHLHLCFDHISKHLELPLKNPAVPQFSISILGVWKCDQTLVQMFDILLLKSLIIHEAKTKENHKCDGFLKCDPKLAWISQTFPFIFFRSTYLFEKLCHTLALVFWSQIQTPWTFVKNEKPPLCLLFQLQFSVFTTIEHSYLCLT